MQTSRTRDSKAWLFWTGLLLASLILTVQVFVSTGSSQALSPLAAGVTKTVEPPSIPPGQTLAPHYTVTFSNPATTTLILDWVTDTLPADWLDPMARPARFETKISRAMLSLCAGMKANRPGMSAASCCRASA